MRYLLSAPSQIKATIQLPASKSISNRALIIHALSKGDDVLLNLSDCDDTQVMIKALTEGNEVIGIYSTDGHALSDGLSQQCSGYPIPSPERNGCSNAPYRY